VRSSLNRLALLAVALIFQTGFCPALCLARSAAPAAVPLQDAPAPQQASCHMARQVPADAAHRASSAKGVSSANGASSGLVAQIPSRSATPDSCGMDCSQLRGFAAASAATSVDPVASPAAVSNLDSGWLHRSQLASLIPRGSPSEPPPRDLLLVKSSFLI